MEEAGTPETECDKTRAPCSLRRVQLDPENVKAWDLFLAVGQEPAIGAIVSSLRSFELEGLTTYERSLLAVKLGVIASAQAEITRDDKAQAEEAAKQGL
jgi:hypothetical protein